MPTIATFDTFQADTTFGFRVAGQRGLRDGAAPVPQEVLVAGLPGAIIVGPDRTPVREIELPGWIKGADLATAQANMQKMQALLLDGNLHWLKLSDFSTIRIQVRGVAFEVDPYASADGLTINVRLVLRSPNPFWQDITAQSINFTTIHTNMPQGTADGWPVLTSPTGILAACTLKGWDYNDVEIWSATLAALGGVNDKYRIKTEPGIMSLEKSTDNGSTWSASDASLTAGRFPMVLPSNGTAYQTSTWPKLSASVGTWNANYAKQWR